jgi:hypothetical protein
MFVLFSIGMGFNPFDNIYFSIGMGFNPFEYIMNYECILG